VCVGPIAMRVGRHIEVLLLLVYIYITLKSLSGAVPFNMFRVCKTCPFALFLLLDFF